MLAIGLMSGTSLDGVDAALIETDGEAYGAADRFPSGNSYADADARRSSAEAAALRPDLRSARAPTPRIDRGGASCSTACTRSERC